MCAGSAKTNPLVGNFNLINLIEIHMNTFVYTVLILTLVLISAFVVLKLFGKSLGVLFPQRLFKARSCEIEYLTYIDHGTKCALLHHKNKSYLLLLSKNNNLLLDSYEKSEKSD